MNINVETIYIYSFDWNKQAYDEVTPEVKFEQNKILSEVKSIKKGLDNIINNTNYINSELKEKNILH